jgi:hypothetical protein
MDDRGKSDDLVVPANLPNNALGGASEAGEGRGSLEGDAASETRPGRRAGPGVSSELDRVRQLARKDKDVRFTALLHHVDVDRLRAAYFALRPKAAPGVDGVRWHDYGQDLEDNLRDLHARVHGGSYRAKPSRRTFIPKPDGRLRPLGIAALEDKVLQRAVVEVLNAIYGKRRTTGMKEGNGRVLRRRSSSPRRPRPCVGDPRGRSEALDRGARRPAIEPRNAFDRGADAIVDDGRQHRWRRFREPLVDPAGSENPLHACDLFMLRTGRSHGHPRLLMMPRPLWLAGWHIGGWRVVRGTPKAVIP